MAAEVKKEIQLEIAHVLFIDIVGYSKLSINDQRAAIDELNQAVRTSEQFQNAEAAARLIKIPTGDGMALVFYKSPEEAQRTSALGGDDGSLVCAGCNRRWDRNGFALSREIGAGCAGKKHCGAAAGKSER